MVPPLHDGISSQKCSDMARIFKGSQSFNATQLTGSTDKFCSVYGTWRHTVRQQLQIYSMQRHTDNCKASMHCNSHTTRDTHMYASKAWHVTSHQFRWKYHTIFLLLIKTDNRSAWYHNPEQRLRNGTALVSPSTGEAAWIEGAITLEWTLHFTFRPLVGFAQTKFGNLVLTR